MNAAELKQRLAEVAALPGQIEAQLRGWEEAMHGIAYQYRAAKNFLFLGRGLHYPIAREGALKLKESAYLHAEGYPSGELKHGPNALVAEGTPLVMIATVDHSDPDSVQRYEKVIQLMRDMREQHASILAIANTGDETVSALATTPSSSPRCASRCSPSVRRFPCSFSPTGWPSTTASTSTTRVT